MIVGFRTAIDGGQTKNPSTLYHVNLKNAYVTLNSDRYPAVDYNLSFSNQKFSRVYGVSAADIQIKANFTENVPANKKAFELVISDNMLSFQSDGNKMSVVY